MTSSRLFTAAMMLFWIATLALIALVCTWTPRGGIVISGMNLFAGTAVIDSLREAMAGIGLSARGVHLAFALIAAANVAAGGLLIFATMFLLLGREQEQREARPMVEGAAAVSAFTAFVVMALGLAGGQGGALMALQLVVLAGLLVTLRSLAELPVIIDAEPDPEVETIISRHAGRQAAFSAQLASISRREPRP